MENLRKIMPYLDGTMTPEESHHFREQLKLDTRLREEVNFLKDVNEAILDDEAAHYRKMLHDIVLKNQANAKKRPLFTSYFRTAAAALLLLLVTTLLIRIQHQDSDTLFMKYYQPYEIHIATRSNEHSNSQLIDALWSYRLGDYSKAYQDLNEYLANYPTDIPAHFYLGLSALETDHPEKAIREFTYVTTDPSTPFLVHAQWYLSLVLIKTGSSDFAHDYLEKLSDSKNVYTKKARQLKRKI